MTIPFSQTLEKGVVELEEQDREGTEPSIGDQLRELRRRLKLTQDAFAKRFDIPIGNVRNWEQGTQPDSMARLLIKIIAMNPDGMAEIIREATESSVHEMNETRRRAKWRKEQR
jgi:DNA-binding transcriptional regulator YiaG